MISGVESRHRLMPLFCSAARGWGSAKPRRNRSFGAGAGKRGDSTVRCGPRTSALNRGLAADSLNHAVLGVLRAGGRDFRPQIRSVRIGQEIETSIDRQIFELRLLRFGWLRSVRRVGPAGLSGAAGRWRGIIFGKIITRAFVLRLHTKY